jgi:hypothetical protein
MHSTNKWILAPEKKDRKKKEKEKQTQKPKIQSTEFKRLNKLKCPSEDTSVPLGRKKAIISGEGGREGIGREWGWGQEQCGAEGNLIWYCVKEED